MSNPNHILVIRFSAMGDVAMTVPVLRALTDQYPDLKITIVTRAFFKPFFQDLERVHVFSADLKGKHKGIFGLYKLSRALRQLKFDAVADLHNVLRSQILKFFFLGKQTIQIDKGRSEKKALTSGTVFKQLKSTHQRYADVFKQLGYDINLLVSKNPVIRPISNAVSCIIEDALPKQDKWIGIAPFAAYKGKMYPLDKMTEVIQTLAKSHKIFLFGGGEMETEVLASIASDNDNVINLAGQLDLEDELDVISNLDVMVSMDSGNGHIAAMLGVKVITIWGVTHPFAGFAPFGQPAHFSLLADREAYPLIPTSVYGNTYPDSYENAAESISKEVILEHIKSVLEL